MSEPPSDPIADDPTASLGPPQITDSPWFWGYLFGVCALIGLTLAVPKFGERQAQIERSFQGRQRAAQNLNSVQPDIEMSTADNTLVSLKPLFVGVGVVSIFAWIMLWRTHQRHKAVWLAEQARLKQLPDAPSTEKDQTDELAV